MNRIRNSVNYVFLTVLFSFLCFNTLFSQPALTLDAGKFNAKQKIIGLSVSSYKSKGKSQQTKPFFEDGPAFKSKGRAFLQSLILPGWGQYYAKSKKTMRFFIVTEVLAVGSYIGFSTWSNWLEDDYRTFAVTHAGVDLNGKEDDYFVDIGNFDNIDDFNQAQLRDRDLIDFIRNTEAFYWQWDSEQNRAKFEDLRIRSDRASNHSEFALAAIFLNHLVSAIHSTLSVYNHNKKLSKRETGFNINFMYDNRNQQLALNISKTLW